MPASLSAEARPQPLTALSEEERLFQASVRQFAREQIAPHVRAMDADGVFRKDLIRQFFELGLMGIEIPEEYGGQGGTFFQCVLAVDQGDHFLLTGRKLWITNAAESGLFLLFANANPEAGYRGITAFLIEREFPGFQ